MTGLPEYRNGGLLLDMGLLEAKHPGVTGQAHGPEEEVGVGCWCALFQAHFPARLSIYLRQFMVVPSCKARAVFCVNVVLGYC